MLPNHCLVMGCPQPREYVVREEFEAFYLGGLGNIGGEEGRENGKKIGG